MNQSKWTLWRVFWVVVMLAELYMVVQVLMSDQKGEAALVMIVVNIFALPVFFFLMSLRGLIHWIQRRRNQGV